MSKTDELLETIAAAKELFMSLPANLFEELERLDEIAEIVKRDAEIVRCGECKLRFTRDCAFAKSYEQTGNQLMIELNVPRTDNSFCSFGERREDNHGA